MRETPDLDRRPDLVHRARVVQSQLLLMNSMLLSTSSFRAAAYVSSFFAASKYLRSPLESITCHSCALISQASLRFTVMMLPFVLSISQDSSSCLGEVLFEFFKLAYYPIDCHRLQFRGLPGGPPAPHLQLQLLQHLQLYSYQ